MRSSKTAQNFECSFSCVARSAVLLKPNVVNILLLNFWEQKFVQHGPITIKIDCNGISLLIFEEEWLNYAPGPKFAPNSDSFWVRRFFNLSNLIYLIFQSRVFCAPNATILLVYIPAKIKMRFIWKDDFFLPKSASSVSRLQVYLAKRKRIGWSIGFNSWTNWTLYGVIPRTLCKIRLNDGSEIFNCWERRWIDVDVHKHFLPQQQYSRVNALVYRWGCQFHSLFSQDNEHKEPTVLLFFQNPYAK